MSDNFQKIEAVFSTIVGEKVVVSSENDDDLLNNPTVSVEDLFQCSYNYTPYTTPVFDGVHVPVAKKIDIYVRLPHHQIIALRISTYDTILDVKSAIEMKSGISTLDCRLRLLHKDLHDQMTVESFNIQTGCTLYVLPRLKGGNSATQFSPLTFNLPLTELAPEYDYDFTNKVDDGKTYMRGGHKYERPYGFERFALSVIGKYEDDSWLGSNGIRTESAVNEWPVAYHGTQIKSVKPIIEEGMKIGTRERFGPGVYTSPSLSTVQKTYAQTTNDGKHTFMLQVRVDPTSLKVASKADKGFDYWISPENNAVRPYGIIVRKNVSRNNLTQRGFSRLVGLQQPMHVPPAQSSLSSLFHWGRRRRRLSPPCQHRTLIQK